VYLGVTSLSKELLPYKGVALIFLKKFILFICAYNVWVISPSVALILKAA
jgi:hypothetical protein